MQSPVHSAHVGQELEVRYRWHPYFGCKITVRLVEQRASGTFLRVQGPTGAVVSIAGWMVDAVACAGMGMGAPRVDLAALIELKQLLSGEPKLAHCRNGVAVVPEEGHEISQIAGSSAAL